jgi:hypothetical protein
LVSHWAHNGPHIIDFRWFSIEPFIWRLIILTPPHVASIPVSKETAWHTAHMWDRSQTLQHPVAAASDGTKQKGYTWSSTLWQHPVAAIPSFCLK